jgi:DNA polymerase III subunit delta'
MAFKDVLGHETSIEQLQRGIRNDRVAHSYLFWGNEGIGKKWVALQFAKALNCLGEETTGDDACDQCVSCRKVDHQRHPDVLLIEPENQTIKKDQILQMQKDLSYRPYEGRHRVCILTAADHMAPNMSNTLLKTLEEPPLHTVLILLANHPRRLLPTIVSRCQSIRFHPLPVPLVSRWLTERHGLDEPEARVLASLSEGSPGKALELREKVAEIPREELLKNWVGLKTFSFDSIQRFIESLPSQREHLVLVLEVTRTLLRDLILGKTLKDSSRLIHTDLSAEMAALSDGWTVPALMKRLDAVHQTILSISPIRGNANTTLALEAMMLSWAEG